MDSFLQGKNWTKLNQVELMLSARNLHHNDWNILDEWKKLGDSVFLTNACIIYLYLKKFYAKNECYKGLYSNVTNPYVCTLYSSANLNDLKYILERKMHFKIKYAP